MSETPETIAAIPVVAPVPDVAPTVKQAEDAMVALGQRTVNMIWETTQMHIALAVIWTSLIVGGVLAVAGKYLGTTDVQLAAIVFLFGVANLVTGFYFGRTNHTRQGGVGTIKPDTER